MWLLAEPGRAVAQETIFAENNRIKLFDSSRNIVILIGGIEAHTVVAVALSFVLFVLDELDIFALDASVWHGCRATKLDALAACRTT